MRNGLKFLINKRRLPLLGMLAIALLLAFSGPSANAQVNLGSMVGSVTDATRAAVSGAAVKITQTATNDVRTTQTNDTGSYTIPTLAPGPYRVEISRQGFRAFVVPDVLLNANSTVRIDAQLQVGSTTERVEVTANAAVLQTERADVNAVVTSTDLIDLPQPNRTYSGLLEMIPGTTPPSGQLSGGTNNPDKGMQFSFNGTGTSQSTVRIEGVSALNVRSTSNTSYSPSIEAIANVNVVTNAADAEQGLAGGATVNVMFKSGTNDLHGSLWIYNSITKFEARAFFAGGLPPPHMVINNTGVTLGGPVKKDKLFFFFAYEGDFSRSADSATLSFPNAAQTGGGKPGVDGDFSGSANPIYDPYTGTYDGRNRLPFPGNKIPYARMNTIVRDKMLPFIPPTNKGGAAVNNNIEVNRGTLYNLHKYESKVDYNATSALRASFRYGKHPYYNFQEPIYGEILGGNGAFPQSGAGNYLQHGASINWAGIITYVASPTLVLDATIGKTDSHQVLWPHKANEKYAEEVMGIPGANQGPLPWSGSIPTFSLSGFTTMGMSYTSLEYIEPLMDYMGNVTKIQGSHTIRAGGNIQRQAMDGIENRMPGFTFNGAATTLRGGVGANSYNMVADFLLGLPQSRSVARQLTLPYESVRTWLVSMYVRDNWKITPRLTANFGVRWEKYPVPTQRDGGIYILDWANRTINRCGVGALPMDCGIAVSNKLFAPSLGIAYRPIDRTVVRAGYSMSPSQNQMQNFSNAYAFPNDVQVTIAGDSSWTPSGWTATDQSYSLYQGLPIITAPPNVNGVYPIPRATGNATGLHSQKPYRRGYIQSWNVTVEREFGYGWLGSAGYVGMHSILMQTAINQNYGTLGGGAASQPWFDLGITSAVGIPDPYGHNVYHSLQSTVTKRYSQGFTLRGAYTYSKDIGLNTAIRLPGYEKMNRYIAGSDRTHHLIFSGSYQLPFGKGKPLLSDVKAANWILGGWTVTGIWNRWSGTPFTVSASGSSCNCPGNSQTADLFAATVAKVGTGVGGQPYFDPLVFGNVTGARFGTGGFNQLRGPGVTNIDLGVNRIFKITERWNVQLRAEALNATNTPHFGNPSGNLANRSLNPDGTLKSLGGFSQINAPQTLGRLIDQRYMQFALRIGF